jgi:uncharacterized protein DUF4266
MRAVVRGNPLRAVVRWWLVFAIGVAAALSAGCAPVGVKIWERDILAKAEMRPDHDAVDRSVDDHIYFSKEASSGGRGFGGGGCGCN